MAARLPKAFSPNWFGRLIRYGNRHDCGYYLPAEIPGKIEEILSFGLSLDWSFERHLLNENPQITAAHFYDHTVDWKLFVKNIGTRFIRTRQNLKFADFKVWSTYLAYRRFFAEGGKAIHFRKKIGWRNDRAVTLVDALGSLSSVNILLKVDIEGAEYRILRDVQKNLDRFCCIVIEFHDVDLHGARILQFLRALEPSFAVCCINVNNYAGLSDEGTPLVIEMVFARRSCVDSGLASKDIASLPPVQNNPKRPPVTLEFYNSADASTNGI